MIHHNQSHRRLPRRRASRALGALIALVCALPAAGCTRSSSTSSSAASPPDATQRRSFPEVRQCMAAVEEPASPPSSAD